MKKSLLTMALGFVSLLPAAAQLNGDGFYRVQNTSTNRFIVLLDDKTNGIQMSNGDADQHALATIIPGTNNASVISNPASIFYITKASDKLEYNLRGQGTDAHSFIGYYLTIENARKVTGAYTATGTAKGFSLRLGDNPNEGGRIWFGNEDKGEIPYKSDMYRTTLKEGLTYWYIKPVSSTSSDCYFGIAPDIKADGYYYKSFYAGFGFKALPAGMKAKYITKVDNGAACAVYKEIKGTVPQSVPMIIECTSDLPANNKLDLIESTSGTPKDNCLTGVYFNHEFDESINSIHNVQTPYDATTMRILGTCKDGSLGYVKSSTLKYIPANTAYLKVTADAPDELKIVSEEEYEYITGIQDVKMDDNAPADIYDLTGVKVRSNATTTEGLKKGVYIIKGKKVMVD